LISRSFLDWTKRLPAPVPTPSNASAEALQGKLIDASAAIHEVAFEALKTFVSPAAVGETFVNAASGFLKMLSRFDSKEVFGFFKDGLIRGEVAQTSVATEYLCRQFSEYDGVFLHWMHQLLDPLLGKMDIALYVSESCDGPMVPVAVIEAGFKGSGSSKHWQAAAYSVNIASQCKDDTRALLSVELSLDQAGWQPDLALHCYAAPSEAESAVGVKGLWTTTIWKGKGSQDALARMFKVLVAAAPLCIQHREILFARMGANVGVSRDGRVYKFFDYRYHSVAPEQRRLPDLSVVYLQAQREIHVDDLDVISYPLMDGSHHASRIQGFIDIAKELRGLHDKNICHGDIRAYNMLFCTAGPSHLLDFDFAGQLGSKKYPTGYSKDINDAQRHNNAIAGARLAKEHDCFSLASVMELHACKDGKDTWTSIFDSVRKCKLADAIEKMQDVAQLELQPSELL
jgi:hypothetical protein